MAQVEVVLTPDFVKNVQLLITDLLRRRRMPLHQLAYRSGIRYRRLQRINKDPADMTLRELASIAHAFGIRVRLELVEHDWSRG